MPGPIHASRQRLRDRHEPPPRVDPAGGRADLEALSVGEVFEMTVRDVLVMGESTGFHGAVDVGVSFNSVVMHRSGLLGAVTGRDHSDAAMRVQLAARIHVGEGSTDRVEARAEAGVGGGQGQAAC